ncbi:hypothetical protein C8J29_102538 [Cereibacter johrii]|uniref:Terminase large subunit n=1 Tax=Cereibacter johrii TaxID=445629 RepID=A0ABX5JEK2_9RHOB|nr:hypothetical protein C8J29_102538 [Cereibacter johrii]
MDSNGQPQIDLGDKGDDADDDTPDIAMPFGPNAGQRMLLANLHNRNISLKARQMGFSTLIEVMALDHALFNRDQEVVVIAHTKHAATKLYRKKVCFAYDRLAAFLRELVPTVERSQTQRVLANGNSIEVTSSARGGTPHFLHVSEMGKIAAKYPDKAVEITTGSLQGVPLSGRVFIESTAEGKSGAFYTMSDRAEKKAQAGDPLTQADYRFHFFAWWMMPDCRLLLDQAHRARISAKEHEYFDKVDGVMDVAIDLEQRAWYVNKRDNDFADSPDIMWREYPSTPDECWQASTEGKYLAPALARARKEHRIGRYPLIRHVPVNTFWDLGASDDTSIRLHQRIGPMDHFPRFMQGSGEGLFRHFFRRVLREGQNQDSFGLTDARLDEVGGLGGDDAGLAQSRTGEDQRRILVHDDRKALLRRQGIALDVVEEILPSVQFGDDEGRDAVRPQRVRIACKLPDGRDPRDGLRPDSLGIQLRQERRIQSTGVVKQRRDLTRGGVLGRCRERHHPGKDPVQSRCFLLEGCKTEAGPEREVAFARLGGARASSVRRKGIALIIAAHKDLAEAAPTADALRTRMADLPASWREAALRPEISTQWRELQVRQLFRLTLEGLFFWTVGTLVKGPMTTRQIALSFLDELSAGSDLPKSAVSWVPGTGLAGDPVTLLRDILTELQRRPRNPTQLVAALIHDLAFSLAEAPREAHQFESSDRLPLARDRKDADSWKHLAPGEFLVRLIGNWIMAQHAYWSVGREGPCRCKNPWEADHASAHRYG